MSRRTPEQQESTPEPRIPNPGSNAPIGVFDSGVGGLSVLREIRRELPAEDLIYVADSGYAPYGDRPEDYVRGRALSIMEFLRAQDVKAVVVACNTASTIVLPDLRARFSVPFVGTVPAIKPACAMSQSKLVSVLGTQATVGREYTQALIRDFAQGCHVTLVGSEKLAGIAEAYTVVRFVDGESRLG